MTINSKKMVI